LDHEALPVYAVAGEALPWVGAGGSAGVVRDAFYGAGVDGGGVADYAEDDEDDRDGAGAECGEDFWERRLNGDYTNDVGEAE
jgi:hypothetical protein